MIRSTALSRVRKQFSRAGNMLLSTAALLGGAAAIVRGKTAQAERRFPPQGKFIQIDGVRLHYIERGSGPVLVLLHGNVVMAQDFTLSPLFDLASARYRVIAFDRPGFGYSERPEERVWTPAEQAELFFHALQKMKVERPYVLGHSWGAFVALELALRHPEFVAGVILASGYYYPSMRLDGIPPAILSIPGLGDLLGHTVSPLVSRALWPAMLRMLFEPGEIPARYDAFPIWLALRPSQLHAVAEEGTMLIPSALAFRNRLQTLAVPTMIIAGDSDKVVDTEKESIRLHREIPHTQLRVIKGAGHMVHYAAPQQVMDAIDALAQSSTHRARQN